jgi:hypothetical protein
MIFTILRVNTAVTDCTSGLWHLFRYSTGHVVPTQMYFYRIPVVLQYKIHKVLSSSERYG